MGNCSSLGKDLRLDSSDPFSVFVFRKQADVIGHVGVGSGTMTHAWRISMFFFPYLKSLLVFSIEDLKYLGISKNKYNIACLGKKIF